ncbi:MAG TPA: methylated-DNA--[protein]-cysteine S-methyltransferase [Longimicrobiales bacterium]
MIYATRIPTPIGEVAALVEDDGALVALPYVDGGSAAQIARRAGLPDVSLVWDSERGAPVAAQLDEYFRGERRAFDLPLRPRGTPFQQRVWRALLDIPYGATISYGALAARVGRPGSARAVGRANGTNPIPIIIPCHRVVGADGALTGYGGGIERKQRLLALEGALLA